jgi:phosphocarrier protein
MLERDLQVNHPLGLHAQASAKVVQALTGFRSQAFLLAKGREVNAKSIMGVMLLAAGPGTAIKVRCDGADEVEALDAVAKFFESGF